MLFLTFIIMDLGLRLLYAARTPQERIMVAQLTENRSQAYVAALNTKNNSMLFALDSIDMFYHDALARGKTM